MIGRLRHSLFGRMVIAQAVILLVTAALLTYAQSYFMHRTLDDFLADQLFKNAQSIASPTPDRRVNNMRENTRAQFSSRSFAIIDSQGQLIDRGSRPLPIPVADFAKSDRATVLHRGQVDAVIVPIVRNGKPAWVIVAQDRTHPQVLVDDIVSIFLTRFFWVIPAGLLVSLLANVLITAATTRSVALVARQVDRIDSQNLDLRVDAERLPLEVRPLARATNDALDRLAREFDAQGKFISDVAHELRTPLALINLRAEGVEDTTTRLKLHDAVGRASRVVTQLMELARVENAAQDVSKVDPEEMASDAVIAHAPLVFRSEREISFTHPSTRPGDVMASEPMVELVLANLIENAVRHTPVGTKIALEVDADGAIVVSDDGPGISADLADPDHPRYRRKSTARTDGAGLGLKIVQRIMAALHGKMEVAAGSNGGTRIRLVFPPALADCN